MGTSTLLQMGQQREQLENAHSNIGATRAAAQQAGTILRTMWVQGVFWNAWFMFVVV